MPAGRRLLRIRALGDVAVLATFFLALAMPTLHGFEGGADSADEGRALAPAPAAPSGLADLAAWPRAFEKWYDDHFGHRSDLLTLNTKVLVQAFGVSPSEQVVLGEHGWLYYTRDGIFADRRGEERLERWQLERWREVLEERRAWFASRGIPYVFAVAPNKVTIYPEHLPPHHRARPDVPTRMDQLVAHFGATDLPFVDLRPTLAEAARSAQVYHATDSHWNELGAFAAYGVLLDAWRKQGLAIEPLQEAAFDVVQRPRRGDLRRLLSHADLPDETAWFLEPRETLPSRRVELPPEWKQIPPAWKVWETPVVYEAESGEGVLLSVGDSFQWQLMPLLASGFRRAVFVSATITDLDVLAQMVEAVKPTAVLEERVERNVKWLPRTAARR